MASLFMQCGDSRADSGAPVQCPILTEQHLLKCEPPECSSSEGGRRGLYNLANYHPEDVEAGTASLDNIPFLRWTEWMEIQGLAQPWKA